MRGPCAALAFLAAIGPLACQSVVIEVGHPPAVERLESALAPGRSTAEDVVRELGLPSGTGESLLPQEAAPRPLWAYVYERSASAGGRPGALGRTILWIYFRDGRYDGYLWFSSLVPRSGGGG